jgi:hypothetical protein
MVEQDWGREGIKGRLRRNPARRGRAPDTAVGAREGQEETGRENVKSLVKWLGGLWL